MRFINYRVNSGGSFGETYITNCPLCGDERKRLYVSYLFGTFEPEVSRRNLRLFHCFNEQCHLDGENGKALAEIFQMDIQPITLHLKVRSANSQVIHGDLNEIGLPGQCIQLNRLSPGHRGLAYIRGRGFRPSALQRFGVEYLERGHRFQALDNRIFIPFYRRSLLVGWTARAVDSDNCQRWLHSPGSLDGLLFGLNGACQGKVLVLVEGPFDKFAVGRCGVAILGKRINSRQCDRLVTALASSPVQLIVALLDPDQDSAGTAKQLPHHNDVMATKLRRLQVKPVLDVRLPAGTDPGSLSADTLTEFLASELRDSGYLGLGKWLSRNVLETTAKRSQDKGLTSEAYQAKS